MCNIVITNILDTAKVILANKYGKRRGPDKETIKIINNILFMHNLLSITGDNNEQPYINENIVIIFNGEIYNYKYNSELEYIYKLYKCGIENMNQLDGEYAIIIVDFEIEMLYMIHDTFGTKPLYIGIDNNNKFCISSYPSVSTNLKFSTIAKIPPNCVMSLNLRDYEIKLECELMRWDLNQYKMDFNDFNIALEAAILKRATTDKKILVNMSSGYDTGTICCVLNKLGIKYNTATILGIENKDIIRARNEINRQNINEFQKIYEVKQSEAEYYKAIMKEKCENIEFMTWDKTKQTYALKLDVYNDPACIGLVKIYENIGDKIKIVLSGSGADEIMSDYSINGNGLSISTCFNGIFPNNLSDIFPKNCMDKNCIWKHFYYSTQELYLFKEESICGGYGLEGRYPYLDKNLIQEFLWLNVNLKNKKYKMPLNNYMTSHNYPFIEEKKGFNPFS